MSVYRLVPGSRGCNRAPLHVYPDTLSMGSLWVAEGRESDYMVTDKLRLQLSAGVGRLLSYRLQRATKEENQPNAVEGALAPPNVAVRVQ